MDGQNWNTESEEEGEALKPRLHRPTADYIPSRKCSGKKLLNSTLKKYRHAVMEAAAEVSHQFHNEFLDYIVKEGVSGGFLDPRAPSSSVENIKKGFLFYLNASGQYLVLREHLRHAVSNIIQQKCTNVQPRGFKSRREFQSFLHDTYLFLVDEMHETLNPTAMQEDSDYEREAAKSEKTKKSKKGRKRKESQCKLPKGEMHETLNSTAMQEASEDESLPPVVGDNGDSTLEKDAPLEVAKPKKKKKSKKAGKRKKSPGVGDDGDSTLEKETLEVAKPEKKKKSKKVGKREKSPGVGDDGDSTLEKETLEVAKPEKKKKSKKAGKREKSPDDDSTLEKETPMEVTKPEKKKKSKKDGKREKSPGVGDDDDSTLEKETLEVAKPEKKKKSKKDGKKSQSKLPMQEASEQESLTPGVGDDSDSTLEKAAKPEKKKSEKARRKSQGQLPKEEETSKSRKKGKKQRKEKS